MLRYECMDHLTSGCGSQVVSMLPDMSLWDLFHSQFTLICINPYNMTVVCWSSCGTLVGVIPQVNDTCHFRPCHRKEKKIRVIILVDVYARPLVITL